MKRKHKAYLLSGSLVAVSFLFFLLSGCIQGEANQQGPPRFGLRGGDFNRFGPMGDDFNRFQMGDFNMDMIKEMLNFPADATDEEVKGALGLPADASIEDIRQVLRETREDFGGFVNE